MQYLFYFGMKKSTNILKPITTSMRQLDNMPNLIFGF